MNLIKLSLDAVDKAAISLVNVATVGLTDVDLAVMDPADVSPMSLTDTIRNQQANTHDGLILVGKTHFGNIYEVYGGQIYCDLIQVGQIH